MSDNPRRSTPQWLWEHLRGERGPVVTSRLLLTLAGLGVGGFILYLAFIFGPASAFAVGFLVGAAPGAVSALLTGRWRIDQINVQRLIGVVAIAFGVYLVLTGQVTLHTWVLAGAWAIGWWFHELWWVKHQEQAERQTWGASDV